MKTAVTTHEGWWPSPFGADDQLGMLNTITPDKRLAAARLVERGVGYDLGHVLDEDVPAFPGRSFRQSLLTTAHQLNRRAAEEGAAGLGDNGVNWVIELVSATSQLGTHLDALNHLQIGERFYNGHTLTELVEPWGTNRLGMETVPQIVTRGVLVDVARAKGVRRLERGYAITVHDVETALDGGPPIERGDAVLFHTGWGDYWMRDNEAYLSGEPGPGLELARWLVEAGVALTGCDTWSFGPVPPEDPARPFEVPQTLNVRHGLFIVENLYLAELAADGVRAFMFTLTHPKLRGATGAWVSPLALV